MKKFLSIGFIVFSLLLGGVSTFAAETPTTVDADNVTETTATLNGTTDDAADNTSFWWGTSEEGPFTAEANPTAQVPSGWSYPPSGTGAQSTTTAFSHALSGLTASTTYYFVAWANVGGVWNPGDVLSFTTDPTPVAVTGVNVDATATLTVGDTHQLTATVTPVDATNTTVSWQTDAAGVATVDSNGLVTAVGVGTANITVTTQDGSFTAVTAVTVNPALPVSCNGSTFDSFTTGSVNGQDGWSATGPSYDHEVVVNTYGFNDFGCKTFRISDEVASGSFGDWVFTKSQVNEAGETSALNGGFSGGTRQPHYEASFQIASALQTYQPGMHVSVSPDRGDGARMSYLRFDDQADGIHVFFNDYSSGSFNETEIATIDRNPHTIKFVIDFVDGPSNDIVKIYIDGNLEHTGTSWEDYFIANEGGTTRTVDSLIIQVRGASTPANAGNGFLFDNFDITTGPVPTYTLTYAAGEHGTITGSTTQTVLEGENGTEVTAVPDSGYRFDSWSDGVTTASRTDTNVTGDLNVTANFERRSGGGGSSGSRPTISTSANTSTSNGGGEVLGAETFQFTMNLGYGMTSPDVVELQARLRAEGYFTYPTNTGYFGPYTLAAVKAYQAAHPEIGFVTGFVGPLTRAVLNK